MSLDGAAHSPLFKTELTRAITKHPPEKWAQMKPAEMMSNLLDELKELWRAILADDLDGPHGVDIEVAHVQIVAHRIGVEMRARNGRQC